MFSDSFLEAVRNFDQGTSGGSEKWMQEPEICWGAGNGCRNWDRVL